MRERFSPAAFIGLEEMLLHIRTLTGDDALAYRNFRLKALSCNPDAFATTYGEYESRPMAAIIRQLEPTPYSSTLGAFSSEQVLLGTVALVRNPGMKVRHIAEVVAMFVDPAARRQGLGRRLMQEVIIRTNELDHVTQLRLSVVQDNIGAVKLYQSLGFRIHGTEPNALFANGRYWDELQMTLPFPPSESRVLQARHRGFSHVTIDVSDLNRSLHFYVEVLGMTLVHRGLRDVYLEWGDAWVCLQECPEKLTQAPQLGINHIAFYIDEQEFEDKVNVLRQNSVKMIRGPIQRGGGWTANFLDADGTELEFHTGTLATRMKVWR